LLVGQIDKSTFAITNRIVARVVQPNMEEMVFLLDANADGQDDLVVPTFVSKILGASRYDP
jgi:polynucleotide 5'-kinase involved in rRNA processing